MNAYWFTMLYTDDMYAAQGLCLRERGTLPPP